MTEREKVFRAIKLTAVVFIAGTTSLHVLPAVFTIALSPQDRVALFSAFFLQSLKLVAAVLRSSFILAGVSIVCERVLLQTLQGDSIAS